MRLPTLCRLFLSRVQVNNISTTQKYMGEFDTQRDDAALNKVFVKEDEADKLLQQLQGVNPEVLKAVLERLTK